MNIKNKNKTELKLNINIFIIKTFIFKPLLYTLNFNYGIKSKKIKQE